jgi:hypothetical protein
MRKGKVIVGSWALSPKEKKMKNKERERNINQPKNSKDEAYLTDLNPMCLIWQHCVVSN